MTAKANLTKRIGDYYAITQSIAAITDWISRYLARFGVEASIPPHSHRHRAKMEPRPVTLSRPLCGVIPGDVQSCSKCLKLNAESEFRRNVVDIKDSVAVALAIGAP